MRYITKGREPASLTQYKKQSGAYFDGANKEDIRQALLEEQGYLCAYCMCRISAENMKIEHWQSQSEHQAKELDYSNMLGVCNGNAEHVQRDTTCDTHRGNSPLTINPLDAAMIDKIAYSTSDGKIYSKDAVINHDLNEVLNLNCNSPDVYLCINRKEVFDQFIQMIGRKMKEGIWEKNMLQRLLRRYEEKDAEGKYRPYSGIVIWYLKKRLK